MNSLMPAQSEPWAHDSAAPPYAGRAAAARPLPPPRLVAPAPPRRRLPPRPVLPAVRHARAIRVLDLLGAATALVLLAPVLLAVALAVKLLDPGPLLFAHVRLGQGGRAFRCLKFRSMTVDADARLAHLLETDPAARAEWQETQKLRSDPRITPLGRFLRRSCLDELPQLVNVLRGEMSLVGPRPIVAGEAARYGRHFPVYCSLKPGITGLWQVKRQDRTSYRRRVAFDLAYARSRSFALNLRILLLTVPSVLRGEGAC
ncbi:MAG: sugar transferase [Novosphingobium sp.]|uniref:sugar transferase n=1 Tax=Novosphingobium sp. TaxID=1874826 RepID=UPI00301600CD